MFSNEALIEFFRSHWIFLLIFAASLIRIVPSKWVRAPELAERDPRMTLLGVVLESIADSIIRSLFPLLAGLGLKATVPLIVFAVVIFDLFIKHQISTQAVTLIALGIVALYLEELVKTGKKISFFGVITWERKEGQ